MKYCRLKYNCRTNERKLEWKKWNCQPAGETEVQVKMKTQQRKKQQQRFTFDAAWSGNDRGAVLVVVLMVLMVLLAQQHRARPDVSDANHHPHRRFAPLDCCSSYTLSEVSAHISEEGKVKGRRKKKSRSAKQLDKGAERKKGQK